jgi:hypothetical protein
VHWIILASIALLIAIIVVVFLPLRLEVSAKGQGELGKLWAWGMGAQIAFITLSLAVAHGMDGIFQVHVFGKRIFRISPLSRGKTQEDFSIWEFLQDDLPQWRNKAERWFGLGDLSRLLASLLRYIRLEQVEGRLVYATHDVALTGIICGSLYTLAGLMAPFGSFHVEPEWVDIIKARGNAHVVVRFYPGKMLLHLIGFTFKNIRLKDKRTASSLAKTEGKSA